MGATGPRIWDCSAFVGAAWRSAGVHLPRTSYDIRDHGFRHVSRNHMQPGDIIELYGFQHVGIYVGNGYLIHESFSQQRAVRVTLTYLGPIDAVYRPG